MGNPPKPLVVCFHASRFTVIVDIAARHPQPDGELADFAAGRRTAAAVHNDAQAVHGGIFAGNEMTAS